MQTARPLKEGFSVRPYQPGDRPQVRRICWLTGYMGEPADWYWRDQESFADMWSGYYTDVEPESAFVAERAGQVVGYLLGCVDSTRAWNPARVGARHALRRLCLFRPGTAGVLWRTVADVGLGKLTGSPQLLGPFLDPRWPSHLHIDLLPEARGSGVGGALVETFMQKLVSVGSPGCHLETLAENRRAIRFFETVGFEPYGDTLPIPGQRSREGGRLHRLVMVRSLA